VLSLLDSINRQRLAIRVQILRLIKHHVSFSIGKTPGREGIITPEIETFSQRYERGSTMVTSNLPFAEWTEFLGSERLTGALLDRLTHHVHILEMNGDSFRLKHSRRKRSPNS
jgi:hypothetical protein